MFSKSEFFRAPLPSEAVAALVEHLATDRVAGQARELDFTPWGGAYNRVPADATAFVHRDALFLLKHAVAIEPDAAPAQRDAARGWLRRSWSLVHALGSGGVYANFPDPDLEDWARAYHGGNYQRLRRVKRTYDPDNRFRFPQSVEPAG
jgi:FAD/FMN-containing dehydrogenase